MVAESSPSNRHGVVCLFCGAPTLLSPSNEQRLSAEAAGSSKSAILLVRCHLCLKEAPYGREKVAVFAA